MTYLCCRPIWSISSGVRADLLFLKTSCFFMLFFFPIHFFYVMTMLCLCSGKVKGTETTWLGLGKDYVSAYLVLTRKQ